MGSVLYIFWSGFSAGAAPAARNGPWFVVAQDGYQPGSVAFDQWHQARAADAYQPGSLTWDGPERLVQR